MTKLTELLPGHFYLSLAFRNKSSPIFEKHSRKLDGHYRACHYYPSFIKTMFVKANNRKFALSSQNKEMFHSQQSFWNLTRYAIIIDHLLK